MSDGVTATPPQTGTFSLDGAGTFGAARPHHRTSTCRCAWRFSACACSAWSRGASSLGEGSSEPVAEACVVGFLSVVRTLVAHRASESFGVLPKGTYATPAPLQSRHDSCFVNPVALTFRASGLTFHADAPVLQQL